MWPGAKERDGLRVAFKTKLTGKEDFAVGVEDVQETGCYIEMDVDGCCRREEGSVFGPYLPTNLRQGGHGETFVLTRSCDLATPLDVKLVDSVPKLFNSQVSRGVVRVALLLAWW